MNQSQFEKLNQKSWEEFEMLLHALEEKTAHQKTAVSLAAFPALYRQLCNQYGLAQTRHYSPALVDRLHHLVRRGHRLLYTKKNSLLWTCLSFIARDFPQSVRRHYRLFWLSFLLFYGPAAALGLATYLDPALIYSLMDEGQVVEMESMYGPENKKVGRASERSAETNLSMFGFYILNNISIGFRTFAGGIVFGLGTVFFLVFNGLMIGGVAGYLSHPPYQAMFWQFVPGHGAFELTAIVISGAAGLVLGNSLLRPGPYRRSDSLKLQAPSALKLVLGAALMLLIAAFVEAFWSSSSLTATTKYWVAAFNWILVASYLLLMGKGRYGP